MALIAVVSSVFLLQFDWFGPAASEQRGPIDTLFDVMIVLSCVVFAVVMVMFGYAIWKFRVKPGDEGDGKPIHGNTRLEIAWTVIPTIIVLFGGVYSWIVLDDIEAKEPDRMPINVTGQQFKWTLRVPRRAAGRRLAARLERAPRRRRPADRGDQHRDRRPALVLGARVGDQARPRAVGSRRRRGRQQIRRHARTRRARTHSSAPSSAGSDTRRCGRRSWSSRRTEFDKWVSDQTAAAAPAGGSDSSGGAPAGASGT